LQLHVVETQVRALARQQTILKRALELPDDTDVRPRLHFANAAATLGAAERQARIDAYLDGVQSKMNVSSRRHANSCWAAKTTPSSAAGSASTQNKPTIHASNVFGSWSHYSRAIPHPHRSTAHKR
ncbi:MAG: hypothetical protein ACXVAF_02795, partial [Vulcanimicrobiaceae bacterium]